MFFMQLSYWKAAIITCHAYLIFLSVYNGKQRKKIVSNPWVFFHDQERMFLGSRKAEKLKFSFRFFPKINTSIKIRLKGQTIMEI